MRTVFFYFVFVLFAVSCQDQTTTRTSATKTDHSETLERNQTLQEQSTNALTTENNEWHYFIASTSGTVEKLNAKSTLKKGQVAFRLNNTDRFTKHTKNKKQFQKLMNEQLQLIPKESEALVAKWKQFVSALQPDTLLPRFPKFEFREEVQWFGSKELINTYNALAKEERSMGAFFVKFPEHGKQIEWNIRQGARIQKGDTLAKFKTV